MKFRKKRKEMAQVNLTPLIDIVFLLLIFFMVSTSFTKENQLRIDLPQAQAQVVSNEPNSLSLLIEESGTYSINGRVLANSDMSTLMQALEIESGGDFSQSLIIVADANATHQSVVSAMDAAGQLGFVNLRISTKQPAVAGLADDGS